MTTVFNVQSSNGTVIPFSAAVDDCGEIVFFHSLEYRKSEICGYVLVFPDLDGHNCWSYCLEPAENYRNHFNPDQTFPTAQDAALAAVEARLRPSGAEKKE